MFEGPETFVIGNDSVKRCYIHGENKFVLVEEIFPLKIISVCLSLLLENINSLTAIEGIIYPITLQIICNQY